MKRSIGLLAVLAATLFVGGCTLGSGGKDGINYNNAPVNEEQAEVKANINDEAMVTNTPVDSANSPTDSNLVGLSANAKILNIVTESSEAKYSLNEVLSGAPTFVGGTRHKLSGQIAVDAVSKPATVTIGDIKLDATSFTTDKAMRDNNVIKLILKSDKPENQFIVFHPTSITGVPEALTAEKSFPVKIMGDLTISGITKPATFDGNITWKSDGSLSGSASTDLTYANFGLEIPNFSFLANVDKIVKLEVNLSAK
jgi:polyisoprenoid-binding protein YceI